MARYQCAVCGYIHDESQEGQKWAALPGDWVCPVCGAAKTRFSAASTGPPSTPMSTGPTPTIAGLSLIQTHRLFGYAFLAMYVFFIIQMVPRLWTYQIEFPARTVAHITLGMAIGAVLLVKILIVRFFRRLDLSLAPALGVSLLVGSVVVIGISAPFAFQEALMNRAAAEGVFAEPNLQRVSNLLLQTGLGAEKASRLATVESMRAGREVLHRECVECHDLRTVLAKPRTPENWLQTVKRMADRTTSLNPLEESEQLSVTAYLIAISPDLQRSTQKLRDAEMTVALSKEAVAAATDGRESAVAFDEGRAEQLFQTKCSDCHQPSLVKSFPPQSREEAQALVSRMVEEGLTGSADELSLIIEYLTRTYVASEGN